MAKRYALIVPVYNEASILEQSIQSLLDFLRRQWPGDAARAWQIVIADNASTDASAAIAQRLVQQYPGQVTYTFTAQAGRGHALRQAVRSQPADYYMYIDADVPIALANIPAMLQPLETGQADIVVGKRAGKRPLLRRLLTRGLQAVNWLLFGLGVQDAQCGVKTFTRAVGKLLLRDCQETGYFLDTELLVRAAQSGRRVAQVPIEWVERRYGKRKSKVRVVHDTLAAVRMVYRLSRALYPGWLLATAALAALCALLLASYLFQASSIVPPQFVVAHHVGALFPALQQLIVWQSLLYVALGVVLVISCRRALPWRLLLAIILLTTGLTAATAIATHPTRSQDVYWNLVLARGFSAYQLNPYTTTVDDLAFDVWSSTVRDWRDLSMTHGPLYVLLVSSITAGTPVLQTALTLLKWSNLLAITGSLGFFWLVLDRSGYSGQKKFFYLALVVTNPVLWQHGLVDVHNDVYVLLASSASVYFLLRKKYSASLIALLLGGCIKYVSWFLLPIPVVALLLDRTDTRRQKLRALLLAAAVGSVVLIASGIILHISWQTMNGLQQEIGPRGNIIYSLPGTAWLMQLWHNDTAAVRLAGLVLGSITLAVCLARKQWLAAYSLPFLVIFFFGTPWFQTWYLLWVLPFAGLLLPPLWYVVGNATMFLLPEVVYPQQTINLLVPAVLLVGSGWYWRHIMRKIKTLPSS